MTEYIGTIKYDEHGGRFPIIDENQEIVRCRDCEHIDNFRTTPPYCYREVPGRPVELDGFCAWGERRGE